jgi:hypothetical protein
MTELTSGEQVQVVLEFDVRHSSRHAIDFLTHYDRMYPHEQFGHPQEVLDDAFILRQDSFLTAADKAGINMGTITNHATPCPVTTKAPGNGVPAVGQPAAACNGLPAAEKTMTMFGGTITDITYCTGLDDSSCGTGAEGSLFDSNSAARVRVTFTPAGATAVLAWGGNIASREYWGFDDDGVPLSAGGIQGSPYHMATIDWTLGNIGQEDVQLAAKAVRVPPTCEADCDEERCEGETATCCATITGDSSSTPLTAVWDDADNTTCTINSDSGECCLTTGTAGSYTLTVTDDIGLLSAEDCTFDLTINDNPTCDPDDICLGEQLTAGCAGGSGSFSCEWKNAGGSVVSSSCDFTPGSSGTYTVVCTDTNTLCESDGCPARVADPPSADAGDGDEKCREVTGPTCFTVDDASCTNGSPSWSCSGSCAVSSGGTTISPTVCFSAGVSGSCTCTLTCTGDPLCPPDTDDADFTVFALPVATASANEPCVGEALQLTGGPNGMTSYSWTGPLGFTSSQQSPQVSASATLAMAGVYTLTVTDSNDCTDDVTVNVTVNPLPVCTPDPFDFAIETPQDLAGGNDGTLLASGIATGEPSTSCTATLVSGTGTGWTLTGCSVSGTDVRVTYNIPDPSTASATASIDITLKTANDCTDMCVGNAGIDVACEVDDHLPVCLNDVANLNSRVVAGEDRCQIIDWFSKLTGVITAADCAANVSGGPIETCPASVPGTCPASGALGLGDTCPLNGVDTSADGTFSWCALNTEPNGFSSWCAGSLVVHPNPDCLITADPEGPICDFGESVLFSAPAGMQSYSWSGPGGFSASTPSVEVSVAGQYCVDIVDTNGCPNRCCRTLVTENCRCRVTGGGNDGQIPPRSFADGDDGDNQWTMGGQAGAPSASNPAFGEWTHHQKNGTKGRFVFHGGTASAPSPETFVTNIRCSDPENCHPARPAPSKQIDFDGVGTVKNGTLEGSNNVDYGKDSLHWFSVHLEDLGEPGNQNLTDLDDSALCPIDGHAGLAFGCDKCACADFYVIEIHATEEPGSAVVYTVDGYIHGGNFQIHPLVGETYDGPSCD